mmetsp:Transcript_12362/g.40675  ORF Transcript_12362/g.40675 Transcript_12362/m.40675 type:complete len:288 (-) Transcript_12362:574-1437(-)
MTDGRSSEAADVRSGGGDVSDPAVDVFGLAGVLHLEVAHLELGAAVHRDGEHQVDRAALLAQVCQSLLREVELHLEHMLLGAGKLFARPQQRLGRVRKLRRLPHRSNLQRRARAHRALGERELERDVGGGGVGAEIGFDFEGDFRLERRHLFDGGDDAEGGLELGGGAEAHHGELAARRREGEDALVRKLVELDRLVEVAVVQHHPHAPTNPVVARERRVVPRPDRQVLVERHPQLRRPVQKALHLDVPVDLRRQHVPRRVEGDRQPLHDVDENLLSPLALPRRAPA